MLAVIIVLAVIVGIVLLFGLFVVAVYNGLIRSRVRSREAWSGIDVQLKRRADLVPNLVETVRGYAAHERETFDSVTRARSMLQQAQGPAQAAEANNQLTQALRSLFAVAENYPQLRASENFMALQKELSDIEEKIAYARQFYNRNVTDFNTRIQVFPNVMIANMFNFQRFEFFEAEEEAREAPEVSFTQRP
ncbi:MAG: LemA family protein [Candidatus Bathyarchaeota archaeon]|nr:LemA family protein [Candidatus Bathyarchaeota archaeon]